MIALGEGLDNVVEGLLQDSKDVLLNETGFLGDGDEREGSAR